VINVEKGENSVHGLSKILVYMSWASRGEPYMMTHFHSVRVPPMSITTYLLRVWKLFNWQAMVEGEFRYAARAIEPLEDRKEKKSSA
jgi:hypothetical protein